MTKNTSLFGNNSERLSELIRGKYEHGDPSHDFAHIQRVVGSCQKIGSKEGADLSILIPAAFLHDIVNVPKNHPDRSKASAMAARKAAEILEDLGYDAEKIAKIATVISEHSFSLGQAPSSLESAILQDADRLDAVGAIGIMRTMTCGAKIGASYYDPKEPIAETRELDDQRFSIDHLYVKLFKLEAMMNTDAGKAEAKQRSQFMRDFVEQLCRELNP